MSVFGLGGTIAMSGGEHGVTPVLSAAELLAAVPGLAATGVDLDARDFRRLPGASLTMADITALAAEIAASDADGFVVTQGTDTIEETAYLLDLLHADDRPVVVTGAMRNPTLAGPDGPANLLAAVTVAADPTARGRGCLVVMADQIHAAARVAKRHSTSGQAFCSPDGGPLGQVVEGRPRFLLHAGPRTVLPAGPRPRTPRVALVTVVLGDDGVLLEGLADRLEGLVLAAFGVGHVPAPLVPALEGMAARMPVVLASRTGAGPTLTGTYGFPGSERDLLERGLIGAGFLDPLKARVLLHALLALDSPPATVRAAFAAAGQTDPTAWPWPQPDHAPTGAARA